MYLYGASGHGKVVLDIANELDIIKVEGFVDDHYSNPFFMGKTVLNQLPNYATKLVITVGNNMSRKKIAELFDSKLYANLIHPRAYISNAAVLGTGNVAMANVSVNVDAKIGNHVILNTNASVDHDCKVSDYVHLSPNAALAGNVSVGEGTHVGIGACVIQGVNIGKWCVIGAGTVVINDIPDFSVVVGNPGKIIKQNKLEI